MTLMRKIREKNMLVCTVIMESGITKLKLKKLDWYKAPFMTIVQNA